MNKINSESVPKAKIKSGKLEWLLWLIPLAAAALCGTFVYRDFIGAGPQITIYFNNAEGIVEKNTRLKYLGSSVGAVKSIALATNQTQVKIVAQLDDSARQLARAGSQFWIVRPEVKIGMITGLGTIVSGEYISIQPGTGQKTNVFYGLDKEPQSEEKNALKITLLATKLDSIQEGSPVLYRGIQVGEVVDVKLGDDARTVVIHARIHQDYAPLVRADSKFWNAGGLSFHFGLVKGVNMTAESARTLIGGGIEFATPEELKAPAISGTSFVLSEKAEDKWKSWEPNIPLQISTLSPQTNNARSLLGQ